ncbi:MAG: hypothetical protein ACFFCQ_12880 [Promethearchaeota archaeon]
MRNDRRIDDVVYENGDSGLGMVYIFISGYDLAKLIEIREQIQRKYNGETKGKEYVDFLSKFVNNICCEDKIETFMTDHIPITSEDTVLMRELEEWLIREKKISFENISLIQCINEQIATLL